MRQLGDMDMNVHIYNMQKSFAAALQKQQQEYGNKKTSERKNCKLNNG